jgi:hypothetical protein
MLKQNRYYFIPIINVDGVAMIEYFWTTEHRFVDRRKNMHKHHHAQCADKESGFGVDLNRNFPVDFGQVDLEPATLYPSPEEKNV